MLFADETEVEEDLALRDVRSKKDFAGITFEGHRLNDVKKAMLRSMKEGREEETMNWMIELLFSRHENELWEVLCKYYGRYVRSDKVLKYLKCRRDRYEEKRKDKEDVRNDPEMRYIYMEMTMVLMEKETYDRKRFAMKKSDDDPALVEDAEKMHKLGEALREKIGRRLEWESKEVVEYILVNAKQHTAIIEDALAMTIEEAMIQRLSKEYYIYYEMIERRTKPVLPQNDRLMVHGNKLVDMTERIKMLYREKKTKEVLRRTQF